MKQQLNELLLQSLETELGGVQIYQTALGCVVNKDLQEEWEKYLRYPQKAASSSNIDALAGYSKRPPAGSSSYHLNTTRSGNFFAAENHSN